MKALTIHNPYPYLITLPRSDPRYKPVENRQRWFAHRGDLLIHAGKSLEWLDLSEDGTRDESYDIPLSEMGFGVLWAVCKVAACFEVGRMQFTMGSLEINGRELTGGIATGVQKLIPENIRTRWPELATNRHVEGKYCIVLEDVRKFPEPIQYRGQQFLFDVPDEVVAEQMKAVQS